MPPYPAERVKILIRIAREAATAHLHGAASYTPTFPVAGPLQTLFLDPGGLCLRFVRQCHEMAFGFSEGAWDFADDKAKDALQRMATSSKKTGWPIRLSSLSDAKAGDILGKVTGSYGHIMLYGGNGVVYENTSTAKRGQPRKVGTKRSTLAEVNTNDSSVTHIFRLATITAPEPPATLKVVDNATGNVLTEEAELRGGTLWVPLRPVVESLGYTLSDHLSDQGKVYLEK